MIGENFVEDLLEFDLVFVDNMFAMIGESFVEDLLEFD
jgi:hypothetical protein